MTEPQTPFEAAVELIKAYVVRGDSIEDLRRGQTGTWVGTWGAQIGGWLNGKRYGSDKIIVERVLDQEVNQVFSLKEVFEFIKNKDKALTLF